MGDITIITEDPRIGAQAAVQGLSKPQTITRIAHADGREYLHVSRTIGGEDTPGWWVTGEHEPYTAVTYAGTTQADARRIIDRYVNHHEIRPMLEVTRTESNGVTHTYEHGWDEFGYWNDRHTYEHGNRKAIIRIHGREKPADWHTRQTCTADWYENGQPYGTGRSRAYNILDNAQVKAVRFVLDLDRDEDARDAIRHERAAVRNENLRIIQETLGTALPYVPSELKRYASTEAPFDLRDNTDHDHVRRYVETYRDVTPGIRQAEAELQAAIEPFDAWQEEWSRLHDGQHPDETTIAREYPDHANLDKAIANLNAIRQQATRRMQQAALAAGKES